MSSIKERLSALRAQAGIASVPVARPAFPGDLRARLRRLIAGRPTLTRLAAPAGVELAPGLQLVERHWEKDDRNALGLPELAELGALDRQRLVCFDTETTGLAGGVGTKAFMIGTAQWCGERFVVRQLYLTALAGEPAMLRHFVDNLPRDPIFVSYNGKSYDVPLLKGRFRINRLHHPFDGVPHVDLLHLARRRYRGVYENCRLQTIEREVLRVVREDDLPGSAAPAAWLSFLRGQSNRNLGRVIEHNLQDVKTLAQLLVHLGGHDDGSRISHVDNLLPAATVC